MLSPALAVRLVAAGVRDKERTSDNAPIWIELDAIGIDVVDGYLAA